MARYIDADVLHMSIVIVRVVKSEVQPMTNNNGYFINAKEKPPCNGECHERSQKCHSECKKYIDWKNKYEAQRKAINSYDMQFEEVDSYKIERQKNKKER